MTLVFLTTHQPLSALIRWLSGGAASHVAIGTDIHGVPVLIHADMGGVQVSYRPRMLQSHFVVAEYGFVSTSASTRLARAAAHLGDRYDYVGLFGYIPVMIARWLGRKIKNPLAEPGAMVCSEFVLSLDQDGDLVPEWDGISTTGTTPSDLLKICRTSEAFQLVE